jgi:hypothetical protein
MANQQNFKTNLQTASSQYIKYSVSRIFDNKKDNLLQMEAPTTVESLSKTNIEINFYSLFDNSLVYSDVIPASLGAISTETFKYTDGTSRVLLFIDFSKLVAYAFPQGQYQIVLNFFEDEIGSYNNKKLMVSNISVSQSEVELEYIGTPADGEIENFTSPQINNVWVVDALKQIFNQPNNQDSNIPTISTPLDSTVIFNYMSSEMISSINTFGITDEVTSSAQFLLDKAYNNAIACLDGRPINDNKLHMVIDKSITRFTQEMLINLVTSELDNVFSTLQQPPTFKIV